MAAQSKQASVPLPGGARDVLGASRLHASDEFTGTICAGWAAGHAGAARSESAAGGACAGHTDRNDPLLSPLFADLKSHRAPLRAGEDAQLVVYEALPHAFWYHCQFPETREALDVMAKSLDEKLRPRFFLTG